MKDKIHPRSPMRVAVVETLAPREPTKPIQVFINIWGVMGDEGIDVPGNGSAIAIMYAITAWMFHPP